MIDLFTVSHYYKTLRALLCNAKNYEYMNYMNPRLTMLSTKPNNKTMCIIYWVYSLHWRHNGRDGVSNHQPNDCLLNPMFRRRSKKTSKLRVTAFCAGNSPGSVNSPHKWPVTRKMFHLMTSSCVGVKRFFVITASKRHTWDYKTLFTVNLTCLNSLFPIAFYMWLAWASQPAKKNN